MSTEMTQTTPRNGKISFGQLGGLRGLMRNPGLFLFTLRRGGAVGRDALGNLYFERPGRPGLARTRRWVVYAGASDASTIGPEWHAWLHHLTDKPLPDTGHKPWQLPHQPNLTGTAASYRPAGHDYEGGRRARASADYESWMPDQN
jgi:NADH:ubiquinone oxidoreductase subunit